MKSMAFLEGGKEFVLGSIFDRKEGLARGGVKVMKRCIGVGILMVKNSSVSWVHGYGGKES